MISIFICGVRTAGEIIKEWLSEHGIKQKSIAIKIAMRPNNLNTKLARGYLDTDLINKLSTAAEFNFYTLLAENWEKENKKSQLEKLGQLTDNTSMKQIQFDLYEMKEQIKILARHASLKI